MPTRRSLALGILSFWLLASGCVRARNEVHGVAAPIPWRLQDDLARIVAQGDGRIAVTVLDLATGRRASVNGGVPHPLMSVFKLPLVVVTLADIEAGTLKWDQRVPIIESDLRNISPIAQAWRQGQREPTLRSMLTHVLVDSDNTVGDKLVTLLGGGPRITARLRALGADGIIVAGQELDIDARMYCIGMPEPADGWTPAGIRTCPRAELIAQAAARDQEIVAAPNNATTDALVDLLARLNQGSLLAAASRAWLVDALAATKTGAARLHAGVPPGTSVAHRTGTGEEVQGVRMAVNDAGIVTRPNGDRFAIAVFIAGSRAPLATQEQLIARLARAAWDAP